MTDYDPDEDSRRSYEVAIAAMRGRVLRERELIAEASKDRTDEQALVFLAERVMILRDFASPGLMRAKRGEPAPLNLDDHEPA